MSRPESSIAASTSLSEISRLRVFSCACGHLKNQRRVFDFGSVNDTLDDFHIVYVESSYGVVAF